MHTRACRRIYDQSNKRSGICDKLLDRYIGICDNIFMTVISKKRLKEYWTEHPKTKPSLEDWHKDMKQSKASSLVEMQQSVSDVEYMKGFDRYCSNIKENDYRLIARITWGITVFVIEILTHAEYTVKYVRRKK